MRSVKWSVFLGIMMLSCVLMGESAQGPGPEARMGYLTRAFKLEMQGTVQKGIVRITDLAPYKSGLRGMADNDAQSLQRVFTRYVSPPFRIERIADYDDQSFMNQWVQDSIRARNTGADPATKARDLDIVLFKGTEEKLRFNIKDAWISEISYSELDRAGAGELKETLVVECKAINPIFH